jgi:hypothetical protein
MGPGVDDAREREQAALERADEAVKQADAALARLRKSGALPDHKRK